MATQAGRPEIASWQLPATRAGSGWIRVVRSDWTRQLTRSAGTSMTLEVARASMRPSLSMSRPSTKPTVFPSRSTSASQISGPGLAAARKLTLMSIDDGYRAPQP